MNIKFLIIRKSDEHITLISTDEKNATANDMNFL